MALTDWSTRTKITIVVVLIILFAPIYLLSDYGLGNMAKKYWAQREKSDSPQMIYKIARTYEITFRPEKAKPVYTEWLLYYGGEWEKIGQGESRGYLPWEYSIDGGKLPKPVDKRPHTLTPYVLMHIALMEEKERHYVNSKHLFNIIKTYFQDCPDAVKQADLGLLRDKTRTF